MLPQLGTSGRQRPLQALMATRTTFLAMGAASDSEACLQASRGRAQALRAMGRAPREGRTAATPAVTCPSRLRPHSTRPLLSDCSRPGVSLR